MWCVWTGKCRTFGLLLMGGGLLTQVWGFVFRHRIGLSVAVLVLGIDQVAKYVVDGMLGVGESWPADGFLRLTHVTNVGNTLDLFSGHSLVLIGVSLSGIVLLFSLYWPRPNTGVVAQLAFGLMLAGVSGNLLDRVIWGYVTDFIDLGTWYIFNVADVAILVGLLVFLVDLPGAAAAFVRARGVEVSQPGSG